MTPTREQLASIEWNGCVGQEFGSAIACPACETSPHAPDCWLAACLAAPTPEPQAMPSIEPDPPNINGMPDLLIGDRVLLALPEPGPRSLWPRAGDYWCVIDRDNIRWAQQADEWLAVKRSGVILWTREPRR